MTVVDKIKKAIYDGPRNNYILTAQEAWVTLGTLGGRNDMRRHSYSVLVLTLALMVVLVAGCPSPAKVAPAAAFSADPTSGNAPLTVQFTDKSVPGSASVQTRLWDFGDGQTDSGSAPAHVYQTAGTYTVSLTVTTADGQDSETKSNLINVTTAGGPQVEPTLGVPGSIVKITIPGNVLDALTPMNNKVFFGDSAMVPSSVTSNEIATVVPPLASPGVVALRVEVNGATVVTGFNFEILVTPALTEPPGKVAADTTNRTVDMVAQTLSILQPMIEANAGKDAGADSMLNAIGALNQEMTSLQPVLQYTKEQNGDEVLDKILVNSGFAGEIQDIHDGLQKRLAWAKEMDALEAKARLSDPTKSGPLIMDARKRFILDWLGARLHLALDYANAAMVGLSAISMVAAPEAEPALVMADMIIGALNTICVFIEASPTQLEPESLTGVVGKNNTIASNSSALVRFSGTFKSEKNGEQIVFCLFFPAFAHYMHIPEILARVFEKIGDALLETAEHPDEHKYIIPPLPADHDVPIYAFEFREGLSPNPPEFDAGTVATLDVEDSWINASDEEGGPFDLEVVQMVYEFKGDFFMPGNRPRIVREEAECVIPVTIKHGLRLFVDDPALVPLPLGDPAHYIMSGTYSNWDGSPADDSKVTITIEVLGQTIVIKPTGGEFTEQVTAPPGSTKITVTADDGKATASRSVLGMNATLPETYCVVTNVSGDSLSLIDPVASKEFQRVLTTDVDSLLNGPRDAAFLPDGETLLVLNSAAGTTPNLVALQAPNLLEIAPISPPLMLGEGKSWAMALSPDGKTALVTRYDTASSLYAIDVRQPYALRLISTIDFAPYDTYGTANVCTAVAPDNHSIALVTTSNYQYGGPSQLVILDITNPFAISVLSTVAVASGGGAVAAVPGNALAVVSGTSMYNAGTQKVDGAVDVVDFSDLQHPRVRGKLALAEAFPFGLAVMPDGNTALVTDAGNPLHPSNRLLLLDISNPDVIKQRTTGSPLAFDGSGCPRIGLSPDGQYAVVPNNVTSSAVVLDFANLSAPIAGDSFELDVLPFGVTFRAPATL
jgi:PKD repeat protein